MNIVEWKDWYHVTRDQLRSHGSGGDFLLGWQHVSVSALLSLYDNSPSQMLMRLYPECDWQPWKFSYVPKGYWNDLKHQRVGLEKLAQQTDIHSVEDWDCISPNNIIRLGYGALLKLYKGQISAMLKSVYPEECWRHTSQEGAGVRTCTVYGNETTGKATVSRGQRWLQHVLAQLLPDHVPEVNFRKHPDLISPSTGRSMEVDIWFPTLKLAFEYHGGHHYQASHAWHTSEQLLQQQQRDKEKQEMCERIGITLIIVPHWWDEDKGSIAALISKARPDIQLAAVHATTATQPPQLPRDHVGRKLLRFIRAQKWHEYKQPTGWYVE
jgi:hypothetical protein